MSERRWSPLRHGYAANNGLHVAYRLVGDSAGMLREHLEHELDELRVEQVE